MKAKNKIKNILACVALVFALLLSCSYQTIWVASNYAGTAAAKSYAAENKTDPYEFESAGKWSRSTNYSSVQVDGNTINAFDKTTVSQNLATLVKDGKPSTLWNGDSTTVAEGEDSTLNKYKVMMIDANDANVKQEKEVKDDDDNYVFETDNEGNFIYETDANGTVYYDAASINTSDSKFVPVDESIDGAENAGKYKAKVIKKEPTDIYYYYKSNSISLSKQAYYVLSFWVYTVGDAYASVRVANSAETFDAKVENIKSENAWKKVYMFMETRADGSASTVYISLYFGNTETILGANAVDTGNENDQKITGTVYYDTVELKTINYTDYVNKTIDGVSPEETNKEVVDNYSNRYDYDLIANPNFNGNDILSSEWTNYIPEYIDGSTDDKISSTTREKYEQAYSKYSTISIVKEAEELKHFDTDEDGNKKYDAADTDKENPLMKNGYSTFGANNTILKIDNDSQLYSIGKTSAAFKAARFMYYRVSVWVKAADENSSATVKLYGKVITGNKSEGLLISQSQTVSDLYTDPEDLIVKPSTEEDSSDSDDTMDYNNGWTEVVFYVHGNAYNNIDIQIALLADKNSTVYFDNIRIENILSSEYSSATSSKKLELTFSPSKSSSEQYLVTSITNGYFENITTEELDYNDSEAYTAPYIAASWTESKDNSEDVVAGVVPTGTSYTQAIKEKLGGTGDPNGTPYENGVVPAANNVYAIYAPKTVDGKEVTHDYSITSSSFSLSSSSVYKVSFMMKYSSGTDSNFNGKIKAYLTYSSNKISEQEFNIETTSTSKDIWHTVTFLVRTGSSARSTTITLSVEDAVGTVFFKNVGMYKYSEATRTDETGKEIKVSTDEQFKELYEKYASVSAQKENNVAIVDYTSYNFTMHSTSKVPVETDDENATPETKDYYESFSHIVEENTDDDDSKTENIVNGIVGVVDTTEDELKLSDTVKVNNLKNNKSLSDTALVIYNESELYTTVSPRVTHTLSASSFYTIELYVRTSEFAEGKGLSINMGAISVYFDDVDTTENTENNGYTLYRAIVRTGSSSITGFSINFELGTENDKLSGYALISDINVTKLADVEAYNEIVDAVDENDKNTVVKNFYVEENSGDTSSTPVENQTLINFFLVFSSILLVVALVIALVAFYVKKHPSKKKVKVNAKDNNNYKAAKTKEEKEVNDKGGFV